MESTAAATLPLQTEPTERSSPFGRTVLVIVLLAIAAGAFKQLRIEVGDLLVPVHVFPLGLGLILVLARFSTLPRGFRVSSVLFLVLFTLACLVDGPASLNELIKVFTAFAGMYFAATAINDVRTFRICSLALALALLVMNVKGFAGGFAPYVGYKPLSGISNKNAYSLYALPSMLLSAFTVLHFKPSRSATVIHAANVISSAFILLSGANRSGWVGVAVIGVLLTLQSRRFGALLGVVVLAAGSWGAVRWLGTTDVFEHRLEQTREGYSGDDLREELFLKSMDIAFDNPIFGLGPAGLTKELAKRIEFGEDAIEPHNLPGYLAGGAGLPALLTFCACLIALLRRPPKLAPGTNTRAFELLRMMVVLFVFRSLFSAEIITTPVFLLGLGMPLGLLQGTRPRPAS